MNRHIIHQYATIIEALRRLNELSGDVMTLIVTDESNRMLGTVTDGDIRRGLLNGVTPADLIDRFHGNPHRPKAFRTDKHPSASPEKRDSPAAGTAA